ncbi:unnamed protein product [Ilex paraguariensis]|uniref:Disease resistance protein At4g27190-like leucine-rich repeats domain-containing protein n=2 Tax=Ilex paraguariensis TaxID=185542 RepID=A0ABC8SFA2_9AQUA
MKSLFTGSVVKSFVQLQELGIYWCSQMEYIVAKEEEEGKKSTERIEFPKLKHLCLNDLPMLRSFYPNSDNVAIESLFHRQVLLPSLEMLELLGKNKVHIVDCHMQVGSFDQLRYIFVSDCGLLNLAAAAQLELFRSVQSIRIEGGDALEVVFDLEGLKAKGEQAEVILGQLESLEIHYSSNLMRIWKMVPKGLQGFHNLKTLQISYCGSLRYLLSPVMVNLLVNLRDLRLVNCEMMEEIIETGQGYPEIRIMDDIVTNQEGEEVIVFPRLSRLVLFNLENVTVFYSGKCGLQFPSLDQVHISNCPKLKFFCSGPLCTPKLERVNTSKDQWLCMRDLSTRDIECVWMGDLNKTVQHI